MADLLNRLAILALVILAFAHSGCGSSDDDGVTLVTKRLFVSSSTHQGDVTVGAADTQCQTLADAEGLGGTWKAYLSTTTTSALSRLPADSEWYLVDGTTKVFASIDDIPSNPLADILLDESGTTISTLGASPYIMTGTGTDGAVQAGFSCTDFSVTAGNVYVGVANWKSAALDASDWSSWGNGPCTTARRIYCFEM